MSRRPPTHGPIAPIAELADVLEPHAPAHEDFAFADTVYADDDLLPPPSGPVIYADRSGDAHYVTPLAFPLPDAAPDTDLQTQARVLWAQLRHGLRGSLEEMQDLWASTEEVVAEEHAESALDHARLLARRLGALWSVWQWDRTDVMRAAMIGIAVFLAAATFGASSLDASTATTASSTSDDMRQPRTLEQHTGHAPVTRAKAHGR